MFVIIGLGNPGEMYVDTRHNIGWTVLSNLISLHHLPSPMKSSTYSALMSEGFIGDREVAFLIPTTFMNNSGSAVVKYFNSHEGMDRTLVVVHDDIDLFFGDVRVSYDRGAGGHNGVKSVIDAYGSKEFARIRIGIGQKNFWGGIKRPGEEGLSRYVLSAFNDFEKSQIHSITEKVDTAIMLIIQKGVQFAMQECNKS